MINNIVRIIYYSMISMEKYISILRKHGAIIGEKCEIYKSVKFGSEPYLIMIGNNVRINDGVSLITHDGGLWVLRNLDARLSKADKFGKIKIGNNVHIGNNSIIMPGVTIGDNVIIGCGAVVTHDVPSNTIWGGVPARQIETIDEYEEKIKDFIVETKGMSYNEKKDVVINYLKNKE